MITPLVLTEGDAYVIGAIATGVLAVFGTWIANRPSRRKVEEIRKQVSDNGHSNQMPTLKDNLSDLSNLTQEIVTSLSEMKGNVRSLNNQLDRHVDDASTRMRDTENRVVSVESRLVSVEATLHELAHIVVSTCRRVDVNAYDSGRDPERSAEVGSPLPRDPQLGLANQWTR